MENYQAINEAIAAVKQHYGIECSIAYGVFLNDKREFQAGPQIAFKPDDFLKMMRLVRQTPPMEHYHENE